MAEKYPNSIAFDFMGKSTTYKKFIEETVEDIMEKIVPTIAEDIYLKKTENTKMLLGATPGEQKLYEHKGKFTNIFKC